MGVAVLAVLGPLGAANANPGDVTHLTSGNAAYCETAADDGTAPLSTARFNYHSFFGGVAVDAAGAHVYLGDRGFVRGRDGLVAGKSYQVTQRPVGPGYPPQEYEGIDARQAPLDGVRGVAVDPRNRYLYVAEGEGFGRVRVVDLASNTIRTIWADANAVTGLAADGQGNVYVALTRTGAVLRIGSDGVARQVAALGGLQRIAVNAAGTWLFTTTNDGTVSRVDLTRPGSPAEIVAGGGASSGELVAPTSARLGTLRGIASNAAGNHLFVADESAKQIKMIDMESFLMTTVVGPGAPGDAGRMPLYGWVDLAVDANDHLYIADSDGCVVFAAQVPPFLQTRANAVQEQVPTNNNSNTGGGSPSGDTSGAGNTQTAPQTQQTQIVDQSPAQAQTPAAQQTQIVSQAPAQGQAPAAQTPTANQGPATVAQGQGPPPTPTESQVLSGSAQVQSAPPSATPQADTAALAVPGAQPAPPASGGVPTASQSGNSSALVGGHGEPGRGAARYAMVANEDSEWAGLAIGGAGALVALFVCIVFGGRTIGLDRPTAKARPKGAY